MPLTALILAAGAGTRLGQPKAGLLIGGVPLALLHVRRACEAGCDRVVVVTRRADREWVGLEADTVVSEEPDQAGSLKIGVGLRLRLRDGVLVTPVDALPASVATIRRLAQALGPGIDAVSPVMNGVGGHPVIVRARVLREAYTDRAPPLRDVLHALGDRRLRIEVDDPNVITNLDTSADVLAATGAPPAFRP